MQIKLLIDGGEMQPGPALSQKLGPAGINIAQVIQKVNDATKNFKGMKVPVEVNVNSAKEIDVKVFSPPIAELLKKELGIEKGSGMQKKTKMANASIEQIISVSKTKLPNLLSRNLEMAVKSVLGSCITLGVLVESKHPRDVIREIERGQYKKEISQEITHTSPEKRKELDDYFAKVVTDQEKVKQQEEAAKAAEEAAKAATAATATPVAATGEAAAAAAPGAGAKAAEAKPAEKKPAKK